MFYRTITIRTSHWILYTLLAAIIAWGPTALSDSPLPLNSLEEIINELGVKDFAFRAMQPSAVERYQQEMRGSGERSRQS